jgi:hypothetical protein
MSGEGPIHEALNVMDRFHDGTKDSPLSVQTRLELLPKPGRKILRGRGPAMSSKSLSRPATPSVSR